MPRAVLAYLLVLTAGCGSGAGSDAADTVQLLAAAYPFAWAAEQVGGPDASVTNLVKSGVEPHDVELSPRQVSAFSGADVVVYLRGFQPAVDDAVAQSARDARLDLSPSVDLEPPDSGLTKASSSGVDPHVWLDPVRMRAVVAAVTDRLIARDPDNATAYQERRKTTDAKLTALDARFRSSLKQCDRAQIVTSHAAFGYLARRYGLTQVGIAGLSPESEPAPGRLAQVAEFARRNKVKTIFFESLVDPKLAQTVAAEVGASTAVLDPLEGVRPGDDYLSVMNRNAAALRTALGCT